jgi:hypothetical protein
MNKRLIFVGTVLAAMAIPMTGNAASAKPCNLKCLSAKVNALSGTVGSLSGTITTLSGTVADLQKKLAGISIPNVDGIRIESKDRNGQCLEWVDNNASPRTRGCDSNDRDQLWKIY